MFEVHCICPITWFVYWLKTVIFTNYYASEFDTKLEEFTELEMSINGIKKRTAKGYALKDTAVWWLFSQYKETLESGGYSWDRYVEVCLKNYFFQLEYLSFQYLNQKQIYSIQTVHKELSRASPLCLRYIDGLLEVLGEMNMSEVILLYFFIQPSLKKLIEEKKCCSGYFIKTQRPQTQ